MRVMRTLVAVLLCASCGWAASPVNHLRDASAPPPLSTPAAATSLPAPAAATLPPSDRPIAVPPLDLVRIPLPNGKVLELARFVMGEKRTLSPTGAGADGVFFDLGPSETSFGVPSELFVEETADWAFFSHDGRLTRLFPRRGMARPGPVGGPARSVLILDSGRAAELGLAKGVVVPALGEGSSVVEVHEALTSGEWTGRDVAKAFQGPSENEARHFLDSLVSRFDAAIHEGGEGAPRQRALRVEVLRVLARDRSVDQFLRMQAATRLCLDRMPNRLFRLDRIWLNAVLSARSYATTWIHETGHQAAAWLVGVPLTEKRVLAHGAGFVTLVESTNAKHHFINSAGFLAEVSVGALLFKTSTVILTVAKGSWLLASLLLIPASTLSAFGLLLIAGAPSHAGVDLLNSFERLGWRRPAAFLKDCIDESIRECAGRDPDARVVGEFVFYRTVLRLLSLKIYFRIFGR
jgi:hypothetical protein